MYQPYFVCFPVYHFNFVLQKKYKEFTTEVAIKRFVYKFGERHLSKKTHLNIIIPYVSYETKLC